MAINLKITEVMECQFLKEECLDQDVEIDLHIRRLKEKMYPFVQNVTNLNYRIMFVPIVVNIKDENFSPLNYNKIIN